MVKSKKNKSFSSVGETLGKAGKVNYGMKDNFYTLIVNNLKEKWYEIDLEIAREEIVVEVDNDLVDSLSQEAEELLLRDGNLYNERRARDRRSDYQWMQTVMKQGTSADKIAAHTVQVQDSPVHSLGILRNLVGMVRVGKKKECILAMETLRELWVTDLLCPGDKLRTFASRPLSQLAELSSAMERSKCLVLWWFENHLKDLYRSFVQALDALARESVDNGREKAIAAMCQLLTDSPEQEQMLLSQVVNKLGDPQQKVASKAIYCLNQVLEKHPNMQLIVLGEVEKMLFRPNIGHKAQYYAICFLTQFRLHEDDQQLAVNLIRVYFCFFKACIKKGELDSRMLSVLLMGVNRAFPYGKDKLGEELSQHLDTMHRVVHLSPFNVALHALCLLYQVSEASSAVGDRFYSALYKKLLDPTLLSSSHHAAFLNLLYKALSDDSQVTRVHAFIKRILQVASYATAPLACGMLYLVSQLLSRNKNMLAAVQLEPGTCTKAESQDDDEEEKYSDVKLEEDISAEKMDSSDEEKVEEPKPAPTSASWVHRPAAQQLNQKDLKSKSSQSYDPLQRNPLFSCADKATYTELSALARHHHPTVALFANNILENNPIEYTGDPLQDFTTARFLDRFVFKNPKKLETGPRSSHFSRSKDYRPSGVKSLSVTSSSYLNEEEQRIPCEEVFLYRYLQKKQRPWLKLEKKEGEEEDDDSDADSVASDEFEQLLHRGSLGSSNVDDRPDFADDLGGEFSGEEGEASEEGEGDSEKWNKKSKKQSKAAKKRYQDDDEEEDSYHDRELPSEFAAAEEFAEMLQETGASTLDVAGSSGMANTDNAAVKQLNWESARDRWIKGTDGRDRRGGFKSKRKGIPSMHAGKKRKRQ